MTRTITGGGITSANEVAEESIPYLDANGESKTADDVTVVTAGTKTLGVEKEKHWYVVKDQFSINARIEVKGDVHLILADGCNLTVDGGIQVQDEDNNVDNGSPNALTIYAQSTNESEMGALTATANGEYNAGIGADGGKSFYNLTGGVITINGGIVVATSTNSAGIGGGRTLLGAGYDAGAGGTITINGGTVTATGGGGAGIGGGNGNPAGTGGKITITSGDVTANGSKGGAGIGGAGGISSHYGKYGTAGGKGGNITISGGTVTATGSKIENGRGVGAGIGGGAGSDGSDYHGGYGGNGGVIIISGGTVIATSGNPPYCADIGGGRGGYGHQGGSKGDAIADKIEIDENAIVKNSSGEDVTIGEAHGPNTRKWAYDWSDDGGHWHPCGVRDCPDINHQSKKEAHSFDEETWKNSEYSHWKECIVCGYQRIADWATHSFGDWQSDGDSHWRVCSVCEWKEEHAPSPDQTICGAPQHCRECGYQMTAALAHDWNEWVSNDNGTHSRTCQRDNAHTETVDCSGDAATCDTPQVCSTCGYEMMSALGHDYGDLIPLKEATITSTGMKAHYLCARCGTYFDENRNPTTIEALTIPKLEEPIITTYTITVADSENGSVRVQPRRAAKGRTVTITVTPDDGYKLGALTITDKYGKALTLTEKGDGRYTFKMPASKVGVTATFTKDQKPEPTPSVSDIFVDVAPDAWYVDAVQFAYDEGIMTGTSETTFSPALTTTRGMIVAILHRLEGSPTVSGDRFTDVADGDWYADAVNWAASEGIVNGMSATTFAPNAWVTREQLAAILYNYAEHKGMDVSARADLSDYSDAGSISDWAKDVLSWANAEGLVNGVTKDTLVPQENATRAQVAAIFARFLNE